MKIPKFSLKGTDEKVYSSEDLKGEYGSVIIFWCNHCPYVKAWEKEVLRIVENYKYKFGFAFIKTSTPKLLFDETQEVAKMFGAERIPHVFVFDRDGNKDALISTPAVGCTYLSWKLGLLFSLNALIPSFLSSVSQSSAKSLASRSRPSFKGRSSPS